MSEESRDERVALKLPDALTHVLDECRMVLPGIQALFGFQMIAVFNAGFSEKLTSGQQKCHVIAIALVAMAMALVMTPAAVHRQAEPKEASDRFLRVSTRLLLAAMIPLAIGISLDVFLITNMVWRARGIAYGLSLGIFAVFLLLWFVYPIVYRRHATR